MTAGWVPCSMRSATRQCLTRRNSLLHCETQNPKNTTTGHILCFLCLCTRVFRMRKHIAEAEIQDATDDELLTTGEAARILNSSRQHVVDLCNRGDLPFTTVGTHRRIRRSDVEALAEQTLRLTRDQRRSLWLAYAIAGRLVAVPEPSLETAARNLEQMRESARGQAQSWLDEWERLLAGPLPVLLSAMTSRSQYGRELRQNSPFAGVLSETERAQVLAAWHGYEDSSDL